MRPHATRVSLAGVLTCVALAASGCVRVPTDGPVVVQDADAEGDTRPGIYFEPQPPRPGQTASEVVTGFLEAMKGMPIRTSVAAEFLAEDARASWEPEAATWTYSAAGPAQGGAVVQAALTQVNRYRGNGAWDNRSRRARLTFEMTTEDGEWRIASLPDALIVPESWFADWYQRASLFHFDATGDILVPEPVFVPEGDQAATSLVRGLLAPRDPETRRVTTTAFPDGVQAPLAVPVSRGGVADVVLEGDAVVDDLTTQRMLAQLSWTLRQDPGLRALRLTIGDAALPLPGGQSDVGLGIGADVDPNGAFASADVFGLQRGRLVSGPITDLEATAGAFGDRRLGLRSVGVSLDGDTVAAVSGGGRALLVGPVDDPEGAAEQVVSGAQDLLPPAWDAQDTVWLVDRGNGAARVLAVSGRRTSVVRVPGVSGRDVTHLLVSRDGTRLVVVVRGRESDRVLVARVVRGVDGGVRRALPATRIGEPTERVQVRDIGWRSPTSVSILSRVTDDLAQVRTVPVEGAPGDLLTPGITRIRGAAVGLLTSPVDGEGAYVVTDDDVLDLTQPGLELPGVEGALGTLTFVG